MAIWPKTWNGKLYLSGWKSQIRGQWQKDLKHGSGILTYPSGKKYVGEFLNDLRHGKGTLIFPNGEKYEGEWQKDLCHGKGTFTYPNGDRYDGEWQKDLRHGKGILIEKGIKTEGSWNWGRLEREITETSPSGAIKRYNYQMKKKKVLEGPQKG